MEISIIALLPSQSCSSTGKQHTRASPVPCSHDPKKLEVSKVISWKLKNKSPSYLFKVWKFLLSKVWYEKEISEVELNTIYLIKDRIFEEKSPYFQSKYRFEMESLFLFFKGIFGKYQQTDYKFDGVSPYINPVRVIYSPHAYFGRLKTFSIKDVMKRVNRNFNKIPRPSAFIGVGYKDKGTCRVASSDGSPSWQEVAMAFQENPKQTPAEKFREEIDQFVYAGAYQPGLWII